MGEIVEFPQRRASSRANLGTSIAESLVEGRRAGCARWNRGQGAMSLAARPACAALAMALATNTPMQKVAAEDTTKRNMTASATILAMSATRASR